LVIDDADITVVPGERIPLDGESGSGKSTLIRALPVCGPWGEGRILLPAGASSPSSLNGPTFSSARIALPSPIRSRGLLVDERAQSVLKDISVGYLAAKLDDEEQRWDQTLSGGER
jgi:putative ATP-binding cassette transporter